MRTASDPSVISKHGETLNQYTEWELVNVSCRLYCIYSPTMDRLTVELYLIKVNNTVLYYEFK